MRELRCEMKDDCLGLVTDIDRKGYVYCTKHSDQRRSDTACRRLKSWEIKALVQGGTVPWRSVSRAEHDRHGERLRRLGEALGVPRKLDDAQFEAIVKAIGHSTVPEAVADIVFAVTGKSR